MKVSASAKCVSKSWGDSEFGTQLENPRNLRRKENKKTLAAIHGTARVFTSAIRQTEPVLIFDQSTLTFVGAGSGGEVVVKV